jgi:hypothetical protein
LPLSDSSAPSPSAPPLNDIDLLDAALRSAGVTGPTGWAINATRALTFGHPFTLDTAARIVAAMIRTFGLSAEQIIQIPAVVTEIVHVWDCPLPTRGGVCSCAASLAGIHDAQVNGDGHEL